MEPWKEYIEKNILKFREYYTETAIKTRVQGLVDIKQVDKGIIPFREPCQVFVITFSGFDDVFLIILNSKKLPDLQINVYENISMF